MGAHGTVVSSQARRRWLVVLVVVALLAAVPVLLALRPAAAGEIEIGALRARIAASGGHPFHGYAQSSGLLPVPDLPGLSDVTSLVSGVTEMRTWYASPERWRVDVLDGAAETDLYQADGAQVMWESAAGQLTRIEGPQPVRLPRGADLTPPALGARLLALAAGDTFSPLAAKRVAGVDAAGLRIAPGTAGTTVARVDLWADPDTGLPLQVEITARGGSRPVFVTRFLEVHLSAPDNGVLTPPEPGPGVGSVVTDTSDLLAAANRLGRGGLPERLGGFARQATPLAAAGVYGTGFARFVVARLPGGAGRRAYEQVRTFGTAVGDDAAVLPTGLLTVGAVRGGRGTYLIAGLAEPAVIQQVVRELS
ncbi:LolA-like protein [Actinoplanes sp. RD1]|uniref:hypothetical protein n=1 Tax=Actinoplanes sp. RD1 TaxID=3064538 RepID=UPI002740EF54|nr:hypothetical protein [Actinoplanes sp. RD1]